MSTAVTVLGFICKLVALGKGKITECRLSVKIYAWVSQGLISHIVSGRNSEGCPGCRLCSLLGTQGS